jgi:hypothetical protein
LDNVFKILVIHKQSFHEYNLHIDITISDLLTPSIIFDILKDHNIDNTKVIFSDNPLTITIINILSWYKYTTEKITILTLNPKVVPEKIMRKIYHDEQLKFNSTLIEHLKKVLEKDFSIDCNENFDCVFKNFGWFFKHRYYYDIVDRAARDDLLDVMKWLQMHKKSFVHLFDHYRNRMNHFLASE